MAEAVVTFVTTARKNENLGHEDVYVETKVYRIEFDTEDNFLDWLGEAERFGINTERLTSDIERL